MENQISLTRMLAGILLSVSCGAWSMPPVLATEQTQSFGPGKGKSYTVDLRPEWGVLTLRARMRTHEVVRGAEGWMNGRIPMSFHRADGTMVGGWPNVFGFEGTRDWVDCVRDYAIPEGATSLRIALHNFGVAGTAEYGPLTLSVKRNRVREPANAPLPEGAPADPWSLADAWRETTPTRARWCLNGLWGLRPVLTNDVAAVVPGPDDNWGWGKIPSVLNGRNQDVVVSDWFVDHGIAADFSSGAWYRRDFTMPPETAGRKVVLTFTMLNTRATVFVDGRRAAEAVFPGGEADLTPFVKPGRKQSLILHVTCLPFNLETFDFNAPDRADRKKASVKFKGVTGDVYLDAYPKTAAIADATVETDVRERKATFVAACTGVKGPCRLRARILFGTAEEQVFASETLTPAADGRLAFTVSWPRPRLWDTHTPQNLYRCELQLLDGAGGLLDAALPFTFGFRQIRAATRDLLLNEVPIHLRALYNRTINAEADVACRETALAMCRRLQREGFNYIIAGNYSYSPGDISYMDALLEACDETGMLFSYSLPHIRDFNLQLDKPDVAARYRALTQWAIRRVRNHPSVITYAMNHNATGYTGDQNPLRIDGVYQLETPQRTFRNRRMAQKTAAIARSIDGTRPIYHHESGNLDDFHTVNIYLNWAPVQERSDWLAHWSANGVKPLFFVEWGMPHISSWSSYRGPLFIWRNSGYQSLWASEFAAAFRGDAAYEGDTPETVAALAHEERLWAKGVPFHWGVLNRPLRALTNNYHGIQALYMDDNWRSHRAWGISAMLPWDQEAFHARAGTAAARVANPNRFAGLKRPGVVPDAFPENRWDSGWGAESNWVRTVVGETLSRWNLPDCAFIGGADVFTDKKHHFRPGETVQKTLVVLNDRRVAQRVAWTCELRAAAAAGGAGGTALQTLAGTVEVPAGARRDVSVSFTLPEKAQAFELAASFTFAGNRTQRDSFALESYAPAKAPPVAGVMLYDPVGLTRKEFDRLGIAYARVDCAAPFTNAVRLVIGRGSLTRDLLDRVVVPAARIGARVLVFEQDRATLDALGFRSQEYGLRRAFARYRSKDLALTETMLRDWNGESTLTTPYHENLPEVESSYHSLVWSGFSNRRVWRCRNRGAVATVIPEKPAVGDWRAYADGGFDLQYAPLLEWTIDRGRIVFCQFDVTARTQTDPVADNLVLALVGKLAEKPFWCKCPRAIGQRAWIAGRDLDVGINQDLLAQDSGWYIVSTGAQKPADFFDRIAKGGRALCLGLSKEEVARWSPVPLAMAATNGCYAARIEKIPDELNGLSNADWQWHGAMDFDAFTEVADDGNAALRVVRHGTGAIVFWQVPPWAIDEVGKPYLRTSKRRANAMLSRLLGNLGIVSHAGAVRYLDVPVAEDDPYRYYRW
ncbi:MAG: glycoside hydrolase family 2 TIM barrel-domain containing protein [Kiritimatiellia bacterium]